MYHKMLVCASERRVVYEMGIYLNPGNDAFCISVNDDIYVDKSGMIAFVNSRIGKSKRFICVSRQTLW